MKTKTFLFCCELNVHFPFVIILISPMKSTVGMNDYYYKSEFNFLGALYFHSKYVHKMSSGSTGMPLRRTNWIAI